MFSTRNHDENVIHHQQQAAAAKPLNQSARGLAPKTPSAKAPKTPFGKARHDENIQQELVKGDAKDGKAERNAFVTPANPKTRAPLGAKTTNAKALKTPFLQPRDDRVSSTKPTSPRARRSKIKVHASTSIENDIVSQDPEDREIEYMPPREVPMKDDYADIVPELDYSMLEGNNLTRGWFSEFNRNRKYEEDEVEGEYDFSDYEENYRKAEENAKREMEQELKRKQAIEMKPFAAKSVSKPIPRAAPPTIRARNAASALSKTAKSTFTASTTAARARQPLKPTTKTVTTTTTKKTPMFPQANPRFTAAKAASNTTLGYNRGRVVSANRRPLADIHNAPKASEPKGDKLNIRDLLCVSSLHIDDENADTRALSREMPSEDEEELEVFQLDAPQDL